MNFKGLSIVNFSLNGLTEIPESLLSANELTSLEISKNPIKTLHNRFADSKKLEQLQLSNLSINQTNLFKKEAIENGDLFRLPQKLLKLTLKYMDFDSIPFSLDKCRNSLQELTFSGVPWPSIDDYGGVNAMITHEQIRAMLHYQLEDADFDKLFQYFNSAVSATKGILRGKEMLKLAAWIFKRFRRLTPSKDCISGVPDSVFELTKLTLLDLSFQVSSSNMFSILVPKTKFAIKAI